MTGILQVSANSCMSLAFAAWPPGELVVLLGARRSTIAVVCKRTAHVDALDGVPACVHFLNDMACLKSYSLGGAPKDDSGRVASRGSSVPTSSVTLNFLAKSFSPLSNERPTKEPRISGSASGDRFPTTNHDVNHARRRATGGDRLAMQVGIKM